MQIRTVALVFLLLLFSWAGYLVNAQHIDKQHIEWTTIEGEKLSFIHFQGKPVIVTFWATDCPSCLKEIPILLDFYERYHWKGLEIVAINMYYDPPNHIIEFAKRQHLPYHIVLDTERLLAKAFNNVNVTPSTFLLDVNGRMIWQQIGLFDPSDLELKIQSFLNPT